MSSIKNMMKQAAPEAENTPVTRQTTSRARTATAEASGGLTEPRRPLNLPAAPQIEERKPLSTRMKPSLKKELEAYVKEIRDAGFPATQELVLDALIQELRADDRLRERVAEKVIAELRL